MSATAIFIPAIAATVLALVLILRDANPWRRPETPMLEQLAEQEFDGVDVYTQYGGMDAWLDSQAPTDDQAAWEAHLDQMYSGADDAIAFTEGPR